MRSLAIECVSANMHGVRALDHAHDILTPKLMHSKVCPSGADKFVVA